MNGMRHRVKGRYVIGEPQGEITMQQETRAADVRVNRMQPLIDSQICSFAMAYVPWQHSKTTYELDKALETGTIFPELDKPFLAVGRGCRRC